MRAVLVEHAHAPLGVAEDDQVLAQQPDRDRVAVRLDPSRSTLDEKGTALIRKMGPAFAANLLSAADALEPLRNGAWTADRILTCLKEVAEVNGLKLGDAMQPIRVALTGSTVSEPVNELLEVVGPERSLARMREMARTAGDQPPA